MPRGGVRPGAGRKPAGHNKVTPEQRAPIEELARSYTADAMRSLYDIAVTGKSESARVAAITAILDRGYGRPKQTLEADVQVSLADILRSFADD